MVFPTFIFSVWSMYNLSKLNANIQENAKEKNWMRICRNLPRKITQKIDSLYKIVALHIANSIPIQFYNMIPKLEALWEKPSV